MHNLRVVASSCDDTLTSSYGSWNCLRQLLRPTAACCPPRRPSGCSQSIQCIHEATETKDPSRTARSANADQTFVASRARVRPHHRSSRSPCSRPRALCVSYRRLRAAQVLLLEPRPPPRAPALISTGWGRWHAGELILLFLGAVSQPCGLAAKHLSKQPPAPARALLVSLHSFLRYMGGIYPAAMRGGAETKYFYSTKRRPKPDRRA